MLRARFLGRFEIQINQTPIDIPARKAQSLFAYLIMNSESQHRREKIAGLLWPDSDDASARSKLRYALWQLRSAIGEQYFIASKVSLGFNSDADYWVDCKEIEEDWNDYLTTREIERIIELYEGEFLPGFYEDWVFLVRDQLRAKYDIKFSLFLKRLGEENRWQEVLKWAEMWIALGEIPEPAYQALMVAHSHLGDKGGSAKAFLRLEQALMEGVGVEPSELSQELYQGILNGALSNLSLDNNLLPTSRMKPRQISDPLKIETIFDQEQRTFVTREKEIGWLNDKFEDAIQESGQVVFIAGDAGQGKTSLLKKFGQQAQNQHEGLIIAYATCEAISGIGDPYLPFRNLLAVLAGDVGTKVSTDLIDQENAQRLWDLLPITAQAILNYGPDLLNNFIPGDSLIRRASFYASDQPDWLASLAHEVDIRKDRPAPINIDHGDSEKKLFDQFEQVLKVLTDYKPVVLILDDMQWADPGTCELFFHLARRIEGQRILILSAYRPADITHGWGVNQHPLGRILPELKRTYGEIEINLNQTSKEDRWRFINEYLDCEPNHFNDSFRKALYQHTDGHPLFTVELFWQIENQGKIFRDGQGTWQVEDNFSWGALPVKVEAAIESRIDRLPPKLREILNIASVQGEEFEAELIAAVSGLDISSTINYLSSEIGRQFNLVEVSEIKFVNQTRLSVYRFQHSLYRQFLYENLDVAEKAVLHERIGLELELLYGDRKAEISVQLAEHFEIAGRFDKAINYLLLAGRNARSVSANEQAISYLRKGIGLLEQLPDGEDRDELELAFQTSLGPLFVAVEGYTSEQAEMVFERARELCERTGNREQLAPALWGLCAFYQVRGKHLKAHQIAGQIEILAQVGEETNLNMLAHWMLGLTHTHLGEFSDARVHLESALNNYDTTQENYLTHLFGQNPKVTCLNYLALNLWILGSLSLALEKCTEAIQYAEQISHPYSIAFAHGMTGLLHVLRKDPKATMERAEKAYQIAKQSRFPFFITLGMILRGWARIQTKKIGLSIKLIEGGIEGMQAIGAELARPFYLSLLAEASTIIANNRDGLKMINSAMDVAESSHEHWFKSGLFISMGNIMNELGGEKDEIGRQYKEAMVIAEIQNAKSLELQAAIHLSNLYKTGLESDQAKEILGELLRGFDNDLEDPVLVEARDIFQHN
jgi:predicted ATPase/DNA-binding SARP family transcriptional activator